MLGGAGVGECHCYVIVDGGIVTLYPLALLTSVDGLNVSSPTVLCHGKFSCTCKQVVSVDLLQAV